MSKVAVIGAGSWGSALALVLADNNHDVTIWARREDQINEINLKHTNEKYLPNIELPHSIKGTTDLKEAVSGVSNILIVVPTKAIRETINNLKGIMDTKATIIHASKGIEPGTHKRISEMIEEEFAGSELLGDVVVLSGPSHAEEVSLRQPTTVTSSSNNIEAAEKVQDLFINQHFRVYTNPDLIGVELGGAIKNIIALACGLTNGLGLGDNTKAAIMTRGLAEMARLGVKLGAEPLTFSGLSGLGDLIVTCTSVHSRNWRAGHMLGQGLTLDEVLEKMGMVVEGVRTTKATYELALELGIEMPITTALYKVLFEETTPQEAAEELMGRLKKHEVEELTNYSLKESDY
ncbi:glycerol-3-phosphate dehydrogenase [Alkalihalobacillus alcalophilus ATCC 27647 = CGMCC 1.3604]|uniref:Glycerol-3-phosphate dehydrogenase [NAD(P)+] n=1 Tax=Alkalihalobacillus alcalophilus ATCC 27647 = CGMCC 1.3604 TaxID=1218173 RepID=A0A094WSV7_ALKAL|nr:NAD(P)H-dependent glycerol-3-phosphate dehydrogenase [Alkalihalobacillus alcalophilus]KGA99158.1 glycerol-3-phosphate dehydrogenase [Alkalihalobacillus alcalophilus ATCC 27647 = CGMCC 1.3604]MED1560505.1 NAD(P)H-dependent glycerol-3-phosphate dehydrogenase [Alkalihalobacillus alcalophilus]THG92044.1 glycerol-3-phosphate dehydrogenase [Alkalihalobacillus alcalophilus ATCC 27647 = CGMCC 1.3604]